MVRATNFSNQPKQARATLTVNDQSAGEQTVTLAAGEQRAIALRIVRRELLIMTLACLLVVAFSLRAAQTSGELF